MDIFGRAKRLTNWLDGRKRRNQNETWLVWISGYGIHLLSNRSRDKVAGKDSKTSSVLDMLNL